MTAQEHIRGQRTDRRFRFHSFLGVPVSVEVQAELDQDGLPEILGSLEIEGGRGFLVLSQTGVSEEDVLLMYPTWRKRNRESIKTIYYDKNRQTRTPPPSGKRGKPGRFCSLLD